MENNYFFIKKYMQNTEQKQGCLCNLYVIARNEEFQFS